MEDYRALVEICEGLASRVKALEQTVLRMQGKASSMVKMDDARRILFNCSASQVRNYVAWGIIPKGKYEKLGEARNSPLVFDVDHLNHLKANAHLLRRPK